MKKKEESTLSIKSTKKMLTTCYDSDFDLSFSV